MSEWWTYSLSDFLLFSPRTYYRLFELYNRALWPAQILAIASGIGILLLLRRSTAMRSRLITAVLALCWLWVAWAFHFERYATINWTAVYVAAAFVVEALALLWVGVIRGRLIYALNQDLQGWTGLPLFLFALVVHPLVGVLAGREWSQAEIFGLAPDPTVVGTLGLLLLSRDRSRFALMLIPFLWSAITWATLQALAAPEAWGIALATVAAMIAALYSAFGNNLLSRSR
jgi:Family of unknown function (DUF6064)